MVFGILMVVATVILAIAAYRVMSKPAPKPAGMPMGDSHELEAIRLGLPRHTPRPRGPIRQNLPPVTLETLPPPGLVRPTEAEIPPSAAPAIATAAATPLVPAIDHNVFAALAAPGPHAAPLPQQLARGSVPPTFTPAPNDLDDAETLGGSSNDLEDDALTRTHMNPVG